MRRLFFVLVAALALPGSGARAREPHQRLAGDPVAAERAATRRRAALRPGVTVTPRAIEVLTTGGRMLSGAALVSHGGRVVSASLSGLRQGESYTIRWRATSSDGHTVVRRLHLRDRRQAAAADRGVRLDGPDVDGRHRADGRTSWRSPCSSARPGFGSSCCGSRCPSGSRTGSTGSPSLGGILTLNVGIAAFVMRAADALQLPFGDLLYGDLSPFATKTRFGEAFVAMTLGYAIVTALVLLGWILDRPGLLWPAFAIGLAFASGLSLSGHQGVEPNATFVTGFADWLHLGAAMLWVGGLVALAACVWPLAPELRRASFLRFSRIATVLVAVLVLAGTYIAISRLPAVSDLWSTNYGHALLVKLAIVCVALTWGAAHHFLVRPRLERGDRAPRGVGRSLIGESSIAILVLLVAAVLVNARPPAVEPAGGVRTASTLAR